MILELFRLEVAGFGLDDMRGQLQHVLWYFFVGDIFEIFILFPHLIWMAQCNAEKPLAARFECDDVLTGREDNSSDRHHSFLADRLTDDRKRLLTDFAIRREEIGTV